MEDTEGSSCVPDVSGMGEVDLWESDATGDVDFDGANAPTRTQRYTRPDLSQYLDRLDRNARAADLNHINAYRDWGPTRPSESEREQARFLAACDGGVGMSDRHAQLILNYCRTRKGPRLPKRVATCWKNIERAHAKMCGTIVKVKYDS
jgi:hypothetical protein